MKFAMPPATYSVRHQIETQRAMEKADGENVKLSRDYNVSPGRIILTAPNGSRWALTVSNAGVIGATAL